MCYRYTLSVQKIVTFFPEPPPNFRFLNNTLGCPALQPKYQQAGSVNPHGAQVPEALEPSFVRPSSSGAFPAFRFSYPAAQTSVATRKSRGGYPKP